MALNAGPAASGLLSGAFSFFPTLQPWMPLGIIGSTEPCCSNRRNFDDLDRPEIPVISNSLNFNINHAQLSTA